MFSHIFFLVTHCFAQLLLNYSKPTRGQKEMRRRMVIIATTNYLEASPDKAGIILNTSYVLTHFILRQSDDVGTILIAI